MIWLAASLMLSGSNVVRQTKDNGVPFYVAMPLSTLDYWRIRLRRRDAASPLVPVVVDAAPQVERIEIALGDVQLRLPSSVDTDWLCRVLRGLR